MIDAEDRPLTADEIRAKVDAARRATVADGAPRSTRERRKAEVKQRKGRVNHALLRGQADPRDELWTIRTRTSHKRAVQSLSEELSEPRAKVSIAALMEEAIELLLAKYKGDQSNDA